MIWTNKFNLPHYAAEWLMHDEYVYEEGVVSSTRLLAPARQFALYKWNWDNLQMDVSEMIAARYGTAIHDSIEKVKLNGCAQEQRLYTTIDINGQAYKISGQFDILKDINLEMQKLVDVKSTSVWSYIYNSKEQDYVKQLSVYRYIGNKNGYNIGRHAEIFMIFTDWSKSRAKKDVNYPQLRISIKPIVLWDDEATEKYIIERLTEFDKAVKCKPEELSKCSDEELWKDPDTWAIVKPGRVTALKVCDTEKESREWVLANNLQNKVAIQFRRGKARRCNYCMARPFCTQYKELLDKGIIELDEVQTELNQEG